MPICSSWLAWDCRASWRPSSETPGLWLWPAVLWYCADHGATCLVCPVDSCFLSCAYFVCLFIQQSIDDFSPLGKVHRLSSDRSRDVKASSYHEVLIMIIESISWTTGGREYQDIWTDHAILPGMAVTFRPVRPNSGFFSAPVCLTFGMVAY